METAKTNQDRTGGYKRWQVKLRRWTGIDKRTTEEMEQTFISRQNADSWLEEQMDSSPNTFIKAKLTSITYDGDGTPQQQRTILHIEA